MKRAMIPSKEDFILENAQDHSLMTLKPHIKKNESRSIILQLKAMLEEEGYATSWHDPFLAWLYNKTDDGHPTSSEERCMFYIKNVPIPKELPIDVISISLHVEHDSIWVELSIYFNNVLEVLCEARQIHALVDKHDRQWLILIQDILFDTVNEFSLNWDTEYDVFIEDTLWGDFMMSDVKKVTKLVNSIFAALKLSVL